MADVFLSYAKEDRSWVSRFAAVLDEYGWSVFWDPLIPTGKPFDLILTAELDAARCVVVLWSQHAVGSNWVKDEAWEGANRGILHPILIEDVRPPLGFRNLQYADLRDWRPGVASKIFDKLIADIERTLVDPPVSPSFGSATPTGVPPHTIGYVDVQKVLVRSWAGIAARQRLEQTKAAMQQRLDARRSELEIVRDQLSRHGHQLAAADKAEKLRDFERKRAEASQLADEMQKNLEQQEQDLLREVLAGISRLIERLGRDRGYEFIFERQRGGLVYGASSADVTNEVVELLNSETGKPGP